MLEDATNTELMALGKLAHLCGLSGEDAFVLIGAFSKSAERLKVLSEERKQALREAGGAILADESAQDASELAAAARILLQGQKRRREAIERAREFAARKNKRRRRKRPWRRRA
jgi:TfoX/Sxy family transcriptional regulator of competence genes